MTLEERARELHLRIGEALEYSAKNPEEPSCVVDLIEKALRSAQEESYRAGLLVAAEIVTDQVECDVHGPTHQVGCDCCDAVLVAEEIRKEVESE